MSSVKRYEVFLEGTVAGGAIGYEEHANGEWCLYEDAGAFIQEMGKQLSATQAENATYRKALEGLLKILPSNVDCDDMHHNKKTDLHGAEEDCPPLCRYFKAIDIAREALKEVE